MKEKKTSAIAIIVKVVAAVCVITFIYLLLPDGNSYEYVANQYNNLDISSTRDSKVRFRDFELQFKATPTPTPELMYKPEEE